MKYIESTSLELKREYSEGVLRTIIAFANASGGELIIGITDNGEVYGVEDIDALQLLITDNLRNTVTPDLLPFVVFEPEVYEGMQILHIRVQQGSARPYYFLKYGPTSKGIYIRHGASSIGATPEHIQQMLLRKNPSFESLPSIEQELSFGQTKLIFADINVPFEDNNMKSLNFWNKDGLYTNTALLFSDQCPYTIKLARFADNTKNKFLDRKEFSGSILKQEREIYSYLKLVNQTPSKFDGDRRIDNPDYTDVSLREVLLNMIIHRDYSFADSSMINIYSDRIEYVSFGGLLQGLNLEEMQAGVSRLRNRDVAKVFEVLDIIDAYGTGIPRIFDSYTGTGFEPTISATDHLFRMTLPKHNNEHNTEHMDRKLDAYSMQIPEMDENKIYKLIKQYGELTRFQIQEALGFTKHKTIRHLDDLVNEGKVKRAGAGNSVIYKV